VPESWVCPDCGAGKEDFEMVEFWPVFSTTPSTAELSGRESST